jgi:DNA-binding FadR family transcriptional regulator
MAQVFYVKNATAQAIGHHQAILDCVRGRKPEAARKAMQAHLDQFERVLRLANRMNVDRPGQEERVIRSAGGK